MTQRIQFVATIAMMDGGDMWLSRNFGGILTRVRVSDIDNMVFLGSAKLGMFRFTVKAERACNFTELLEEGTQVGVQTKVQTAAPAMPMTQVSSEKRHTYPIPEKSSAALHEMAVESEATLADKVAQELDEEL